MAHGVIGNTAGFGPVVLGSSPSGPTKKIPVILIGIFCLTLILQTIELSYICNTERI